MGYSGPGYGILSLVVSEKYIWCLDYRGSLYCSALPAAGLRWQKFEDGVQQVAVSPSGRLASAALLPCKHKTWIDLGIFFVFVFWLCIFWFFECVCFLGFLFRYYLIR